MPVGRYATFMEVIRCLRLGLEVGSSLPVRYAVVQFLSEVGGKAGFVLKPTAHFPFHLCLGRPSPPPRVVLMLNSKYLKFQLQ